MTSHPTQLTTVLDVIAVADRALGDAERTYLARKQTAEAARLDAEAALATLDRARAEYVRALTTAVYARNG